MRIAELSKTGFFCPDGGPPYPSEEGLGMVGAFVDVLFENKGRTQKVRAMIDTGALSAYAFLDSSLAASLGIAPGKMSAGYTGVGGAQQFGWTSNVDRLSIVGNPSCSIQNAPVLFGKLNFPGIDALIGDSFITQLKMILDYTTEPPGVSCMGGPKLLTLSAIPLDLIILAGLAAVGVAAVILFKEDIF